MIATNNLNTINNLADLHREKRRLQEQVGVVENELRAEINRISNDMLPLLDIFKIDNKSSLPLISRVGRILLPLFLEKIISRRNKKLTGKPESKWAALGALALGFLSNKDNLAQIGNTVSGVIGQFKKER